MNDLLFACSWDTNRSTSWSGTHLALYNALQEYYNVIDFNMNLVQGGPLEIINKIIKYKLKLDMSSHYSRKAQKMLKNKNIPIFQFGGCPDVNGRSSYAFIDMAWKNVKDLYDLSPDSFSVSNYTRFSKEEIQQKFDRQSAFFHKENCAGILCMGRWLANDLTKVHKNVHHVGGGINIDPSKIDDSKKVGNKILFVGRDFERKNGPLVLEAFSILQSHLPECELYIIGPKNLVCDQPHVHVLGSLTYEETTAYFNLCDIFCMPSKFEAYGLVFPEALTFGLPCIGRNAFEMPYFIEDGKTGYLLKENSAEELACLMENALNNSEMKENVHSKREWFLQEYSWKTVAKRIHAVIDS